MAGNDSQELTFLEHLDELRLRLMRSALYCVAGMIVGFYLSPTLLWVLRWPAERAAQMGGFELGWRIFEVPAGLMIYVQVALVSGVILAGPLLLLELWGFVSPALEPREKTAAFLMLPGAFTLFISGVAFCYWFSPQMFKFLLGLNTSLGADATITISAYIRFFLRVLLVFGLSFELPLLIMFLGYTGIVSSRQLYAWWRYAVVGILILAAIATPTFDPLTMSILAAPLFALYLLSAYLVSLVERNRRRREAFEHRERERAWEDEKQDALGPYAYYYQDEDSLAEHDPPGEEGPS